MKRKEEKMKYTYHEYGPVVLRAALGLLFLIPGLQKLMNPGLIIGALQAMGFPAVTLLGWLVIIAELVCGTALILGWKTQFTVLPLVVILVVATVMVYVPALGSNPMAMGNVLFHILGLAGLVSIFLTGPGASALGEK